MKKVQFLFLLSIYWIAGKSQTVGYNVLRFYPQFNQNKDI